MTCPSLADIYLENIMSKKLEVAAPDAFSRRRTILKAAVDLGMLGLGASLIELPEAHAASAGFVLPPASDAVTPFRVSVPQDAIDDSSAA